MFLTSEGNEDTMENCETSDAKGNDSHGHDLNDTQGWDLDDTHRLDLAYSYMLRFIFLYWCNVEMSKMFIFFNLLK